ncbi:MAG: endo-1,4-beta-xylanase [Sedimentisphaerales bacterium]|nr:endo-1,4-beta-xylanase [Sedimentisphaerales bacterium]
MKFQVFRDGKALSRFPLKGAYLFGADGIAIRKAQIKFKNGFIECSKPNLETAGLTLLWSVDGFGDIVLPTTCLPERSRPYTLNVELARAKLMQIVNKREDWSFFGDVEPFKECSRSAREMFIKSIHNLNDPEQASKLADEALEKAMACSDMLAVKQAELLYEVRRRKHGFGRGCFGCKVDPKRINNSDYVDRVLELFGSITVPVNWAQVESVRGGYDFTQLDACIELFGKKRLAICAGPVLCFSKQYLPTWLFKSKVSFEQILEAAYQFTATLVARYSQAVGVWSVLGGLNAFNHFGFGFEQILELTRAVSMAVKQAGSRAIKVIEISNPWGEYYSETPHTIPPLVYLDMVTQGGINFDAFGLQVHFSKDNKNVHIRDMMQISSVLDFFGIVGKPLYITEVEVPGAVSKSTEDGLEEGSFFQWDQTRQARWIEQFYKIALSKPFVEAVTYGSLVDHQKGQMAATGLLNTKFEPKSSFQQLKKMRSNIFGR